MGAVVAVGLQGFGLGEGGRLRGRVGGRRIRHH